MDMTTYIATTTAFANTIGLAYFNGFFGVLTSILPYGIGIAIFYMAYRWVRRSLSGRV